MDAALSNVMVRYGEPKPVAEPDAEQVAAGKTFRESMNRPSFT